MKVSYKSKDNYIVVIGSNSGIGIALVKQLLETGAIVIGADIQEKSKVPFNENYLYYKVNPLDYNSVTSLVDFVKEKTNKIVGLINLSGAITHFKSIEEISIEEWNHTYDISFKSCFNSCKAFLPLLKSTPNSAIVNMSSGLAFIGQKNYGPYTAGKASVIAFSKTLAAEVAPEIRVNTVAPGAVDTNFIYKEDGSTRFNKEQYEKIVPLGSIGTPEEISSVILFLLSDGATHMTGQCLHVNGGAGMH
ncbi:3-oxoacyl-[acyl-carrier protein] reductase [Maribacter vaceletii]|uniref:3-oxoacyl-[acyl-carrier protein] reductase n=1 Tax=Maribacter vaceletii TaxID=1206816 RepID=A0A495EEL5_9FLAO|nr:SDR family oxidoreductase [Maribacter vaceletii]RKR15196.1 3-oxoacyl-[acyl-carrier protein] reductase [Maribacter vaceletii]